MAAEHAVVVESRLDSRVVRTRFSEAEARAAVDFGGLVAETIERHDEALARDARERAAERREFRA